MGVGGVCPVSRWIDDWAKESTERSWWSAWRHARRGRPRGEPEAVGSAGMSRRDLIRRAGVVGAVAWTVPLIETVVAPDYAAASGGGGTCEPSDPSGCGGTCPTRCGTGKTCTQDSDCQGGCDLTTKKCVASHGGGACTENAGCDTGTCINDTCAYLSAGAPCTHGDQCYSNSCTGSTTKTCAKSPDGGRCGTNVDCASGGCGGSGTCLLSKGAPCTDKAQCASGTCNLNGNSGKGKCA